jgi:enoyl-CoA hydratase
VGACGRIAVIQLPTRYGHADCIDRAERSIKRRYYYKCVNNNLNFDVNAVKSHKLCKAMVSPVLDPDKYIHIEIDHRRNGVAVARLNRPSRLNAANRQMHWELTQLPIDATYDDRVKAVVVTGAGRAFCAGGNFAPPDPDEKPGNAPQGETVLEAVALITNLLDCSKPMIAAVNGPAMGLGASYALCTDIVVAARSATFSDPHVKMGLGAGDGGQLIWPMLMGPNRAKYYLMTGDALDADEAERLGLVNFVVDDESLLPRALEIADRLATGPTLAITASKVPLNMYLKSIAQQILPYSLQMEHMNFYSKDHQEAVKAFQEKRDPVFKGR